MTNMTDLCIVQHALEKLLHDNVVLRWRYTVDNSKAPVCAYVLNYDQAVEKVRIETEMLEGEDVSTLSMSSLSYQCPM